MKKPIFNSKERLILQIIGRHRKPLTVNEVAKESGLSWTTVKKYSDKLYNDGIISLQSPKPGNRIYNKKSKYKLNFKEIYGEELDTIE